MIYINITLVVLALIFFFLSFYTPKQEYFFYGISATLFLIAAMSGFMGYSDLPIGTQEIHNTTTNITTTNYVYSESDFFNRYLPLTELLVALYLFIRLAVIKDGRTDKR